MLEIFVITGTKIGPNVILIVPTILRRPSKVYIVMHGNVAHDVTELIREKSKNLEKETIFSLQKISIIIH